MFCVSGPKAAVQHNIIHNILNTMFVLVLDLKKKRWKETEEKKRKEENTRQEERDDRQQKETKKRKLVEAHYTLTEN